MSDIKGVVNVSSRSLSLKSRKSTPPSVLSPLEIIFGPFQERGGWIDIAEGIFGVVALNRGLLMEQKELNSTACYLEPEKHKAGIPNSQ